MFKQTPGAVARLGETLFLKTPLYAAQKTFVPIYINEALFRRYVSSKAASWRSMSATIAKLFSVTLDAGLAKAKPIGSAWVDYQSDPLQFATRGNEGSGRAYYLGRHFNMKGEKTPLCTSTNPNYSDGVLTMERGLWEAYISNVLDGDMAMGVPPVLAVLDMQETAYVERAGKQEKRVRVIRIDDHGALDRITHIFAAAKPRSPAQLKHTAVQFGMQEGEKFIQRIMYGAWSSGNITPNGDMLDFDTVCAVKGRSPQYSASAWHSGNYFGYESNGQTKILKAMVNDPVINNKKVSFTVLQQDCLNAIELQIAKRLPYLAGFPEHEKIYARHSKAINALARDFSELSRKFYPKLPLLSLRHHGSHLIHALDFSAFFRAYPLMKRADTFCIPNALRLMDETKLLPFPLERQPLPWSEKTDIDYFEANAWADIKKHCVTDAGILEKYRRLTGEFITAYDALFSKILKQRDVNMLDIEARAYVINEDRFYLYPSYTPTALLTENNASVPPQALSQLMDVFITSCKRVPVKKSGHYQADIRVCKEGFYRLILNGKGQHRHCLTLSPGMRWIKDLAGPNNIRLVIDDVQHNAAILHTKQGVTLKTNSIDNVRMLPALGRDHALFIKTVVVLDGKNSYKINDYLGY